MKPLLLHGPAKSASRKKLIELKQRFDSGSVVVYEEKSDLQTTKTALYSQSLFSDQQLIVLENPPDEFKFSIINSELSIVLWFDHEVDVKKWSGFEVLFFPESKEVSVFPFLDLLAAKDVKSYLELDKLKKAGFDIYYFLTMIFYLLRSLAVTPKKAPDFVRKKLVKQRIGFGKEKIISLYKEMLQIDFKIKSGLLETSQAEFLLVNKFLV